MGEAHIGPDLPIGGEQRLGGQAAELEAAAQPGHPAFLPLPWGEGWGEGASGIAGTHPPDPFGRDVPGDILVHLDQDEAAVAAVLGVLFEDRMTGGAGAGKGIQNQRILVGGDLQDALNQSGGFGGVEGSLGVEQGLNFLFRFIGVSSFIVGPPCPGTKPSTSDK